MFEKEAEEYANGKGHEHYNYLFEENAGNPADFARWCFEDGAEFGYNKANEWHKVADGDLPKPNIAVLICFQFEKWTTTYIAYYRPAIKKWQMYNLSEAQRQPIDDDYIDSEEVIAWCEIPTFTDKE